jgi:hypothetical protein
MWPSKLPGPRFGTPDPLLGRRGSGGASGRARSAPGLLICTWIAPLEAPPGRRAWGLGRRQDRQRLDVFEWRCLEKVVRCADPHAVDDNEWGLTAREERRGTPKLHAARLAEARAGIESDPGRVPKAGSSTERRYTPWGRSGKLKRPLTSVTLRRPGDSSRTTASGTGSPLAAWKTHPVTVAPS